MLALKGRKASFLYYVISGVIAIVDELDVGNDKVVANSSKVIKKGYCSNVRVFYFVKLLIDAFQIESVIKIKLKSVSKTQKKY